LVTEIVKSKTTVPDQVTSTYEGYLGQAEA